MKRLLLSLTTVSVYLVYHHVAASTGVLTIWVCSGLPNFGFAQVIFKFGSDSPLIPFGLGIGLGSLLKMNSVFYSILTLND